MSIQYITQKDNYKAVIQRVSKAKKFVWIGTADIKNMHVHKQKTVVPFLSILNDLIKKDVSIRLLHAKAPGPNFQKSFDHYTKLVKKIERQMCPRVHFKHIIIDGKLAYTGSANLTGAGLGIKSQAKRNFESGIITTNQRFVQSIMQQFDDVWRGKYCKECKRREYCPDPIN